MKHIIRKRENFPGQHLIVLPKALVQQAESHPLLRGLYLTAAGYFPEAPGHLIQRAEGLPEMIFIACVAGRGWVSLRDGKKISVQTGEAVLIPAGVPHAYGADDELPWSILWAHCRGQELDAFVALLEITENDPLLRLPTSSLEQLSLDALHRQMEAGYTLANVLTSSARLRLILVELANLRMPADVRARSTEEILRQNIDWMRLNRHRRASLAELAAQTGLSIAYYSSFFKRKTGFAPMNYFQRLKVQHASQLLALTDLRIEEIALAVGIQDSFYFSRLFKKVMGHSPRHFRANRKD
jgi:AraC family transcriptional regulator of arabinose operon